MKTTIKTVLGAYAAGLFPMGDSRNSDDLHWIDPQRRAVFPLDAFHIPRSLRRALRKDPFAIQCDTAFTTVVEACAAPRTAEAETWINPTIKQLYRELFEAGFAHSVECWAEGQLVGGLYGVSLGAAFFGESMFSRHSNSSKIALTHLVARLKKSGYCLLDAQFMTAHLAQFGAVEMSRQDYHHLLDKALVKTPPFITELSPDELAGFVSSCSLR